MEFYETQMSSNNAELAGDIGTDSYTYLQFTSENFDHYKLTDHAASL